MHFLLPSTVCQCIPGGHERLLDDASRVLYVLYCTTWLSIPLWCMPRITGNFWMPFLSHKGIFDHLSDGVTRGLFKTILCVILTFFNASRGKGYFFMHPRHSALMSNNGYFLMYRFGCVIFVSQRKDRLAIYIHFFVPYFFSCVTVSLWQCVPDYLFTVRPEGHGWLLEFSPPLSWLFYWQCVSCSSITDYSASRHREFM